MDNFECDVRTVQDDEGKITNCNLERESCGKEYIFTEIHSVKEPASENLLIILIYSLFIVFDTSRLFPTKDSPC